MQNWSCVSRLLSVALVGLILSIAAHGQAQRSQSVTPRPAAGLAAEGSVPATNSSEDAVDPASLLPDVRSLPRARSTLIGGTVERLDRIRDRFTVRVFGGGRMKVVFDPRTRIYRDGAPASVSDLRQGDRVYIDTVLDGTSIFALNIRVKRSPSAGESEGVVTANSGDRGELTIRDTLSPRTFNVRLNSSTRIVKGDRPVSVNEITPGTLVSLTLGADKDGRNSAREISVLAVPGDSFTFAGQVVSLDMREGLLVLSSSTDQKTHDVYFDSGVLAMDDSLHPGVDVAILARFEGNRYVARSLTINASSQQ